MSQVKKIELAEMITDLREELLKARKQGEGSDLRFEIAGVELEVNIAATKDAGGGGGVKFWVYNADAKVRVSDARAQRLKLTLKLRDASDGSTFEVSDEDWIPG